MPQGINKGAIVVSDKAYRILNLVLMEKPVDLLKKPAEATLPLIVNDTLE